MNLILGFLYGKDQVMSLNYKSLGNNFKINNIIIVDYFLITENTLNIDKHVFGDNKISLFFFFFSKINSMFIPFFFTTYK